MYDSAVHVRLFWPDRRRSRRLRGIVIDQPTAGSRLDARWRLTPPPPPRISSFVKPRRDRAVHTLPGVAERGAPELRSREGRGGGRGAGPFRGGQRGFSLLRSFYSFSMKLSSHPPLPPVCHVEKAREGRQIYKALRHEAVRRGPSPGSSPIVLT